MQRKVFGIPRQTTPQLSQPCEAARATTKPLPATSRIGYAEMLRNLRSQNLPHCRIRLRNHNPFMLSRMHQTVKPRQHLFGFMTMALRCLQQLHQQTIQFTLRLTSSD